MSTIAKMENNEIKIIKIKIYLIISKISNKSILIL